jgi:hypothetical protein
MADGLLITLSLDGALESSQEQKRAVDDFIFSLVADLNSIEAVRAVTSSSFEAAQGSKGLDNFLLGVMTAEVKGELAGLKVVRYLCSRLAEQPHPIRLKVSRKGSDGTDVLIDMELSPRNKEAMTALLAEAEVVVRRMS